MNFNEAYFICKQIRVTHISIFKKCKKCYHGGDNHNQVKYNMPRRDEL